MNACFLFRCASSDPFQVIHRIMACPQALDSIAIQSAHGTKVRRMEFRASPIVRPTATAPTTLLARTRVC